MASRIPAISVLLLIAGCADVDPIGAGSVLLNWQVSPSGCADAGVQVVEARLIGPTTTIERFACTSSEAMFTDLDPGTYRVELLGFDADGEAIFTSTPDTIEVEADATTATPTQRLLASPAQVDVRWTFANGRVCGANSARWISVGVFDDFDYEVESAQFSCDTGAGRMPPLRAGNYLLEVNALDVNTSIVWRGTAPIKVARAEKLIVDVALDSVQ